MAEELRDREICPEVRIRVSASEVSEMFPFAFYFVCSWHCWQLHTRLGLGRGHHVCGKNGKFLTATSFFAACGAKAAPPACAAPSPLRFTFENVICCLQLPAPFMYVGRRACECQHWSCFSSHAVSRENFCSAVLHFRAHAFTWGC